MKTELHFPEKNPNKTHAYLEYDVNGTLKRIELDKFCVVVGRLESKVDFVIDNPKISRIHAEFIVDGNNYYVKDCDSANGTYINENAKKITANTPYKIINGDRITLANVELIFCC